MAEYDADLLDFFLHLTTYSSADVYKAILTARKVGLGGKDIAEMVTDFASETDTKLEDIDVCGVVYDTILQEARENIEKAIGKDIMNDYGFYTASNYIATPYDYKQADKDNLEYELQHLSKEEKTELLDNECVRFFLDAIDLNLEA